MEALVDTSHQPVVVQRANALLALHEGFSPVDVANVLHVSRQTIYNWAQVFQERGDWSLTQRLEHAPRSGRPATALGIIDPLIDVIIDEDPRTYGYRSTVWTTCLLQRYLQEAHAIATSCKSISRALCRLGIRWKRPRHCLAQRSETWQQAKGGSKMA